MKGWAIEATDYASRAPMVPACPAPSAAPSRPRGDSARSAAPRWATPERSEQRAPRWLGRIQPEVGEGGGRRCPSSLGALDQPLLQQVGLVNVLDRVLLLPHGHRQG